MRFSVGVGCFKTIYIDLFAVLDNYVGLQCDFFVLKLISPGKFVITPYAGPLLRGVFTFFSLKIEFSWHENSANNEKSKWCNYF